MALNTALSLSIEFEGKQEHARADFEKLVEFCMSKDRLDLPVLTCAKSAAQIARDGELSGRPVAE